MFLINHAWDLAFWIFRLWFSFNTKIFSSVIISPPSSSFPPEPILQVYLPNLLSFLFACLLWFLSVFLFCHLRYFFHWIFQASNLSLNNSLHFGTFLVWISWLISRVSFMLHLELLGVLIFFLLYKLLSDSSGSSVSWGTQSDCLICSFSFQVWVSSM